MSSNNVNRVEIPYFFYIPYAPIIVKYTKFWDMQMFQGKIQLFFITYCIYEKLYLSLYQQTITIKNN
jgi:hypothetical protein